jgi:hypothetical protein
MQQYHYEVRKKIVDELVRNSQLYEAITADHETDTADYIAQSRMASEGVWGTDVEIAVASTLIQTPIAVFSAFGDRQYLWQVFEPIQPVPQDADAANAGMNCMIYLQNVNNHFEPVIDI